MGHALDALTAFARRHPRLLVLTGAGCSTDSGIPDYRDAQGQWKRAPPMTYQAFTGSQAARQRYWARSLIGWATMSRAQPGPAHQALARLEAAGHVELLTASDGRPAHRRRQVVRDRPAHERIDTVGVPGLRHACPGRLRPAATAQPAQLLLPGGHHASGGTSWTA
ncbi:MAG: Sir2 family NAD-dependent protein deacetylase [Burkholderiaceae bacterium]